VTIETEENIVLRGSSGRWLSLMWCPACRRKVEVVTPERAAQIAGVSTRTIYRWVEAEKLHFSEVRDRTMFVCLDSLRVVSGASEKSVRHASSQGG